MTAAVIQPDLAPALQADPRKPLVVVFLLHTVAYGGIETIIINWIGKLDRTRINPQLVVFENPGQTEDAFVEVARRQGIDVRKIPWSRRKPIFSSSRILARILRELRADIVHTHNVYAEIVGYLAARKVGAKVITSLYVWADFGFKRNIQQWLSAKLIKRFDLVSSQCQITMDQTVTRGVPRTKQRVLISGINTKPTMLDDETRRARRAEKGVTDDHVVLVNVARLYPEKAQDLLLKSFHRVLDARPNARLWILGVGPLEEELRALCASLDLDDAVTFMGFADALQDTLALCDIQVHPSSAEGVPLSICEGMVAGLPILATRVGGVPEVIIHNDTGLLIEPGDEEALTHGCIDLIDHPERWKALGAGAQNFVTTDYSLDAAVDALTRTYEELACS